MPSADTVRPSLICFNLGVPFQVADLRTLRELLKGSSQTDPSVPVPEGHYAEESMKATIVPNRNMIMLAVAAGHAMTIKADLHEFTMTTFKNDGYDEMIVEVDIPFYSLCEHHLAPFFGTATVAYIPGERIVGISKLCRTVDHFARRLQVQERMTGEIAHFLHKELKPQGVAVLLRARHMCQEMRGVRKTGVETVTSYLLGAFGNNAETREEFMSIAKGGR